MSEPSRDVGKAWCLRVPGWMHLPSASSQTDWVPSRSHRRWACLSAPSHPALGRAAGGVPWLRRGPWRASCALPCASGTLDKAVVGVSGTGKGLSQTLAGEIERCACASSFAGARGAADSKYCGLKIITKDCSRPGEGLRPCSHASELTRPPALSLRLRFLGTPLQAEATKPLP